MYYYIIILYYYNKLSKKKTQKTKVIGERDWKFLLVGLEGKVENQVINYNNNNLFVFS